MRPVSRSPSKKQSSTRVAYAENSEKLTPLPSQVAPRGCGRPSRIAALLIAVIMSPGSDVAVEQKRENEQHSGLTCGARAAEHHSGVLLSPRPEVAAERRRVDQRDLHTWVNAGEDQSPELTWRRGLFRT